MDWAFFIPELPTIDALPRLLAVTLVLGAGIGWWVGQLVRPAVGAAAGLGVGLVAFFWGPVEAVIIGGAVIAVCRRYYELPKLRVEDDTTQRASRSDQLKASKDRLQSAFDDAVTRHLADDEPD